MPFRGQFVMQMLELEEFNQIYRENSNKLNEIKKYLLTSVPPPKLSHLDFKILFTIRQEMGK